MAGAGMTVQVRAATDQGLRRTHNEDRHGVCIVQAWGMTETSPLAAISFPPAGTAPDQQMAWRAKTGRPIHGVELRLCDDAGRLLPWDGTATGEIEARGPWVTGSPALCAPAVT